MKRAEGLLLFVVPVVSPERTSSWSRTQQLFERTLRSICAQTSLRFKVVVACHERPCIDFDHPAVRYLEVDCPVPADNRHAKRIDKNTKIRLAIHHGRDFEATHTMNVDADDCVSNRLAACVARHPDSAGWFLKKGYFYSERSGMLHMRRGDFQRWTGTSIVVKRGIFEMPEDLCAADLKDVAALERTYYLRHQYAVSELARRGARLRPLPFPGGIYIVEHGANLGDITETMYRLPGIIHHAKRVIINDRRLTQRIRREFGLYELDCNPSSA